MISAEKFEMLSAYLDDEISLEGRRLVEHWIECDPVFRHQYKAQLALMSAVRSLPTDFFDSAIAVDPQEERDRPNSDRGSLDQGTDLEGQNSLSSNGLSICLGLSTSHAVRESVSSAWLDKHLVVCPF